MNITDIGRYANSLHLTHNQHRAYYQSLESYLDEEWADRPPAPERSEVEKTLVHILVEGCTAAIDEEAARAFRLDG